MRPDLLALRSLRLGHLVEGMWGSSPSAADAIIDASLLVERRLLKGDAALSSRKEWEEFWLTTDPLMGLMLQEIAVLDRERRPVPTVSRVGPVPLMPAPVALPAQSEPAGETPEYNADSPEGSTVAAPLDLTFILLMKMATAPDIARLLQLSSSRVETALRRFREDHPECCEPVGNPRKNEPQYIYRTAEIRPVLERLLGGD